MLIRLVTLFILVFLPLGCALQHDKVWDDITEFELFDTWLYQVFPNDMQNESVIRNLGSSGDVQTEPLPIGHHGVHKWKVTIFTFPGLQVVALINEEPPHKALISSVVVSSSEWKLSDGLSVGQPESNIKSVISGNFGGQNRFCGMNNCITFETSDRVIKRVVLEFYVD
ncbi:MAG: hypothetical protein KKF22_13185 [Gammaproteobacteria bacterium]|nr:hypothetical protein [Gammaproteobacteria bacterium]